MNPLLSGTYTDLYQLTMSQVYYLTGRHKRKSVFDYFFRKLPFDGGFVVFAGLGSVLKMLEEFRFTPDDIDYLKSIGLDAKFSDSLLDFRFKGNIFAAREGEVIFPNEPVLRVEGDVIEAQIIETLLLNIINFQSLIATKAARMHTVAAGRTLCDFGLRRAQGLGGYHATRAAIVGGFVATSNVKAAKDFGVTCVGTMAHAFVQGYEDELSAFRAFAEHRPDNCVLLVDTYDTLRSGVPNAIKTAKEMEGRGQRLQGIRLDSGDLAYLSTQSRRMLDAEGLNYVRITASNQLDEFVIKSLIDQQAPIDVFGVGTSLVTGPPDAALDGVYKLSELDGKARIKLSENIKKTTLPGSKQVFRFFGEGDMFFGADVVGFTGDPAPTIMHHPFEHDKSLDLSTMKNEPLLHPVMDAGKIVDHKTSLKDISYYSTERLKRLPQEYKRFYNPHIYKVGIGTDLKEERNKLRKQYKSS
ncbi:nicotinate phosphoribosyltransferase [Chryseolinea sp. T2]|uniref:nicotinate phosphoribosyltransferase n=1 Tax=Chryseolinea sp. T2 TaxID=3129255 RepID=UPI0030787663